MAEPKITRSQILAALTQYYELGDLSFIDTVNNITFGYKCELKRNLTTNKNKNENRLY